MVELRKLEIVLPKSDGGAQEKQREEKIRKSLEEITQLIIHKYKSERNFYEMTNFWINLMSFVIQLSDDDDGSRKLSDDRKFWIDKIFRSFMKKKDHGAVHKFDAPIAQIEDL